MIIRYIRVDQFLTKPSPFDRGLHPQALQYAVHGQGHCNNSPTNLRNPSPFDRGLRPRTPASFFRENAKGGTSWLLRLPPPCPRVLFLAVLCEVRCVIHDTILVRSCVLAYQSLRKTCCQLPVTAVLPNNPLNPRSDMNPNLLEVSFLIA